MSSQRRPGPSEVELDEDAHNAALARSGDAAAFGTLVRRWQNRVFGLARRFFARPEDAEEVAQEVFLRMHRSLSSWRGDAPFEHWILRIATNVCTDALRERRRKPTSTLSELTSDAAAWLDRALEGESLDAARAEEARHLASSLLDRLPPKDRMVLVLMDLEGMSAEEVAVVTGSTRGAVKVRAFRARRALRRLAGPS